MKLYRLFLAAALVLLFVPQCLAWNGVVTKVSDGDTLTVTRSDTGERVRIRLHGIDAPETKGRAWEAQPYSRAATNMLKELLPIGGMCAVVDMGQDKYSRTIAAVVSLPDGNVVQEEMLRAGLVWVYPQYCRDCRQWKALERDARDARNGLWQERDPVPPWEWRKGIKKREKR